ncbi:MAG: HEPN domain-containing protein [bacterium]
MNSEREAKDHWGRALQTFHTAERITDDNDSAANRCYYAAFHAVSALFALDGKTYKTHAGIKSAVHRDLVNTGLWPAELGAGYSFLLKARLKDDYGGGMHVKHDEAERALETARHILQIVHKAKPGVFPLNM